MEQLGKQIDVPGNFWQGCMSADERSTKYKCTVRNYSTLSHKRPGNGFRMCRLGAAVVAGTGSTKHGDASGEIFWMPMQTFLGFYYETFPDMMPQPKDHVAGRGESDEPQTDEQNAAEAAAKAAAGAKPDVLPDFPHMCESAGLLKFECTNNS